MTRVPELLRVALAVLLTVGVLLAFAAPGLAAEDEDSEGARPADKSALEKRDLKSGELEERIFANDAARWALILGRFVPIGIGILLLVLWFLKRDKIKGGVLPPPPRAVPTLAFSFGEALIWAVAALALVPYLVIMLLAQGRPDVAIPTWQTVLGMVVGGAAVAILLVLRRQRLERSSQEEIEARFGPGAPVPTKAPGLGRAFGVGLWTYCVAGVLVIPATLGWALLLNGFGAEPVTQGPVQDVVDGPTDSGAWLMVFFGIVVAPFTEECIFRGMLYPGLKHALGGGRRAMWISAIFISAIFAVVHWNLFAVIPLFVLALVLTWIFETTNSLAAVIIAHAIHNGVTMVPLVLLRSAS
ncbi:MAG: CPBP family intramembrane metalloprotease [Planctomycetota bacterium]|nr:CPBP family intramembrane metalloprotease [Planctomycetota bacterium]